MNPEPLRHTALDAEHRSLGAKLVPFAGWEMPIQYPSGIVAEHRATRAAVGVFDLSHMGELRFTGPGALEALDRVVSSDIAGLAVGHARYGLLVNEGGTIEDDVIVYRLAADDLLMVVNASNVAKDRAHLAARLPSTLAWADESNATALIAVQGPRAAETVAALADLPALITALPTFGVTRVTVAGAPVIAARTGYTGEDGFELFTATSEAVGLWRALLGGGAVAPAPVPVGLGARDTLRLESRFALYGNDIDETTTPLEAGLGWTCRFEKDFCGREAILREKAAGGPRRRLVGLVVEGGIARHGHAVVADGQEVGRVTSGTFGPTVGLAIALAYVPVAQAALGTILAVRIRDRDVRASVVRTPWYRRTP